MTDSNGLRYAQRSPLLIRIAMRLVAEKAMNRGLYNQERETGKGKFACFMPTFGGKNQTKGRMRALF